MSERIKGRVAKIEDAIRRRGTSGDGADVREAAEQFYRYMVALAEEDAIESAGPDAPPLSPERLAELRAQAERDAPRIVEALRVRGAWKGSLLASYAALER